ncbi:translation initiation factor IF-2 [Candidatus Parcubacteria bacterium]|nr:translation initiation factor IF-2 [Candidatus Parcubacteria bacterium]
MKVARPPVVSLLGHVDHGKSTLLDYLRQVNTVDNEAGGITQHVAAYEVRHKRDDGTEAKITFLDTPGHEAFHAIRARGARAADIAILVVSAEDGVKPQTIEAVKWIRAEKIPMLVAMTKVDKPSADIERVKQSLAENDVYVEGYGGDVPFVPVSAKTGAGVKDLLDMILLLSELEHCTGETDRWGSGVIIESRLDAKKGITAVAVVKDGTVKVGQVAASIGAVAPLRFILDAEDKQVDELTFSSPIQIIGWDNPPLSGATFEIFDDKKAAQFYADSEAAKYAVAPRQTRETPIDENMATLPIIIKADAAGSLEAIEHELKKLSHERIAIKIVNSAVGTISEGDVKTSMTTPGTIIFGFNTKIDPQAGALAERTLGVTIELYEIIYKLTERVEELLKEQEPKVETEEVMGRAKVLKVFSKTKDKQVLGARAESGMLEKGSTLKIMRRDEEVGRGKVKELQQSKVDVETVSEGNEFGALVESKVDIAPGDYLERIVTVTK